SLEIAGKTQEASEFSIKKLSEETDRRTRSMNQNIGSLERAWNDVATAIKNAGNALKNIGKPLSDAEALAEINDRIKEWENAGFWHGTKEQRENMIRNLKEQQKILSFVVSSHEGYEKAQNKSKEADEKRKESIREYNKLLEDTATNAQKRTAALNKLWEQVRRDPEFWTEDKRKLAVQNINNKFKDRTSKTPTYRPDYGTRVDESANQALLSLQAQLKVLKEHKTVSDVISSERKKLWDMEAKISILEEAQKTRQLTKDEKALLAKKDYILASQEALAIAGDEVKLQELHNRELDKQLKRVEEINARSRALELGAGKSGRMYQRDIALEKAKSPDERKALEEYYAKEDSIRANWELGVKKGFAEFQDQATNVYGNVAQISQSAFQGMSNSLSDFVLTGKANFADFTRSFLEMTTKMLMQMAMLNAMKAAFGGSAVGNFFGFASGGYTGDGGKHDPAGVVHKGEFVFTKEATQRLGLDNLYRLMDAGKRGYASGGHVGGSAPMSVT
ncbi:phage tail tape measure protein, partial [Proteus mirabilis]|uniref:phage tail tape measure protein n=1 Tax=Proteus mirabilis TaxID=584 RepID=UPI00391D93DF